MLYTDGAIPFCDDDEGKSAEWTGRFQSSWERATLGHGKGQVGKWLPVAMIFVAVTW